jgi:hypothetical protein
MSEIVTGEKLGCQRLLQMHKEITGKNLHRNGYVLLQDKRLLKESGLNVRRINAKQRNYRTCIVVAAFASLLIPKQLTV